MGVNDNGESDESDAAIPVFLRELRFSPCLRGEKIVFTGTAFFPLIVDLPCVTCGKLAFTAFKGTAFFLPVPRLP